MIAPNLGYGNILTLDLSCSRKRFVLSLWAAENFCPLTWEGTNCCEETESLECRLLSRRGYRILVSWGVANFYKFFGWMGTRNHERSEGETCVRSIWHFTSFCHVFTNCLSVAGRYHGLFVCLFLAKFLRQKQILVDYVFKNKANTVLPALFIILLYSIYLSIYIYIYMYMCV